MGDMEARELTPMVAVDPFHLPQSEPLALTVNNKEKESRHLMEFMEDQVDVEEEKEDVNFKWHKENKAGFTFRVKSLKRKNYNKNELLSLGQLCGCF